MAPSRYPSSITLLPVLRSHSVQFRPLLVPARRNCQDIIHPIYLKSDCNDTTRHLKATWTPTRKLEEGNRHRRTRNKTRHSKRSLEGAVQPTRPPLLRIKAAQHVPAPRFPLSVFPSHTRGLGEDQGALVTGVNPQLVVEIGVSFSKIWMPRRCGRLHRYRSPGHQNLTKARARPAQSPTLTKRNPKHQQPYLHLISRT
jgi:hypothetical protein